MPSGCSLVDQALILSNAGSAGASLIDTQPDGLYLAALAPAMWEATRRGTSALAAHASNRTGPSISLIPARYSTYFSAYPLRTDEEVFGTIGVKSHNRSRHFDAENVRVMSGLADFTAAALRRKAAAEDLRKMNEALRQGIEMFVGVDRKRRTARKYAHQAPAFLLHRDATQPKSFAFSI
jgi:hypothetical protein